MNRLPVVLVSILAILSTVPLHATWDAGVSAFRAGRYEEAVSVFEDFVKHSPQAPQGHYMLGMSLLRQQRVEEAIGALGKALELGPGDVATALALTQAQLKADRADAALDSLGSLDPATVPEAMRSTFDQLLAKTLTSSPPGRDAERILERALAANPKSRPLLMAQADVAKRSAKPETRFSALTAVFELDPEDPAAGAGAVRSAINLARDSTDSDRKLEWYRQAASLARRLATGFPTAEHLMLAGSAEMGAHAYEDALASFQKARSAGADDLLVDYYLGRSKLALDRDEEALVHLQATLDRSPDAEMIPRIHSARGLAYRKLEKFDAAAEAFRLAGDEAQAKEMAGYAENRREWAAAKAECVEKRRKITDLRADSGDLVGTPEWDAAEREFAEILAACEPYFQDRG